RYLTVAELENMAGIILAPAGPAPALGPLVERGRAVVVIDREVPDAVDQVVFDNRALVRRGAEELGARRRRYSACITGQRATTTATDRAAGWSEVLEAGGLDAERLSHANFRVDGGRAAMQELLEGPRPPQAVLATNNLVGVG